MAEALRRMAWRASGAAYVTREALQRSYPPGPETVATHYSSIELPEANIVGVTQQRLARLDACARGERPWTLGFIGSFNVMYKAPDVHLEAVAALRSRGLDVRLELLGDGRNRAEMEALAERLGLAPHVVFHGRVPPGAPVNAVLDRVDLFLIASRTEGLPRALIEAMARGCPAIGSHVGGIPELLEADWRVPAGEATALADRVAEVLASVERLRAAAHRNASEAATYAAPVLEARRTAFYTAVAERSA
jgi:glycosyltransferase involved in cell wall biosynthesis